MVTPHNPLCCECGASVESDSLFCPMCGSRLSVDTQADGGDGGPGPLTAPEEGGPPTVLVTQSPDFGGEQSGADTLREVDQALTDRCEPDAKGAEPVLQIRDLVLGLPNGKVLFNQLDLALCPGEIVVILGGSGAGKSTLARVLFEAEELRQQGFSLNKEAVSARGELGLVPQRGAPLDHLDVAGNIDIARRHSLRNGTRSMSVEEWLQAVDLPRDLAQKGVSVARLSGGQAQRLAVARTLASGRRILFLDEPSVGLDPLRVLNLAALVREQSRRNAVSMLVVTHDIQFACHVADRILFLDPQSQRLVPVLEGQWRGPLSDPTSEESLAWRGRLEKEALALLSRDPPDLSGSATRTSVPLALLKRGAGVLSSAVVPATTLLSLPGALLRYLPDIRVVFGRVLKSAVLRPLPFYLVVSVLLGYTILYVIGRAMPAGLRVAKAVELVGGSYILALTPPISAFLFVATSGSAVNAWLGSMGLTRQTMALEALGIRREKYLWVPGWVGMTLAYLVVVLVFGAGMVLGGAWHSYQSGVDYPWPLLLGDIIDPEPSRELLRSRALWLVGIYAVGIAADVVRRGTTRKDEAEDVTRGMTGSVVACTLWVVFLELFTALLVFPR